MQEQVHAREQVYTEEEDDIDEQELEIRKFLRFLMKKGLVVTYAYHCQRCNYLWFPKDFDAVLSSATSGGLNLIHKIPPKACARCKSKYWNSPPKRNTKHTSKETTKFSQHKLRSYMGSDKMEFFGHDMLSLKRVAADYRATLQRIDRDEKEINKLKKWAKQLDIHIPD
jgi:hypothetical protein